MGRGLYIYIRRGNHKKVTRENIIAMESKEKRENVRKKRSNSAMKGGERRVQNGKIAL